MHVKNWQLTLLAAMCKFTADEGTYIGITRVTLGLVAGLWPSLIPRHSIFKCLGMRLVYDHSYVTPLCFPHAGWESKCPGTIALKPYTLSIMSYCAEKIVSAWCQGSASAERVGLPAGCCADWCILVNEWAWLMSQVCFLSLKVHLGSFLESELRHEMKIWACVC